MSITCKTTGTTVTGSQGTTNQWDKISTGYISHAYVKATTTIPSCTTTSTTGTVDVATGATLSVRSTPSTTGTQVGSLADNASVTLICKTTGSTVTGSQGTTSQWDKISTGYISHAYVKFTGTLSTCSTSTPPPTSGISTGIAWGKTQVGTLYIGCSSGSYRFGVAPTTDKYHAPTSSCPDQTKTYYQPAGVVGYDCSGLMSAILKKSGITLAYTSSTGIKDYLPAVTKSLSAMRPGDMLARSGHVVMYIGSYNGVNSVIESTPYAQNTNGSWKGTRIQPVSGFMSDTRYVVRRAPGL